MEYSSSPNSMKQQSLYSQGTTLTDNCSEEEQEESGWTTYLEDFSKYRSASSYSIGTSLVSDAASRLYHVERPNPGLIRPTPNNNCFSNFSGSKKLSLIKKMRAKKDINREDPLEDTASSPVSSPKVDEYKRMDLMKSGKADNYERNFFMQGSEGRHSYHHHQHGLGVESTDGRNHGMDLKGQNGNSCTNLENRGLCLVPLSLFANYLG